MEGSGAKAGGGDQPGGGAASPAGGASLAPARPARDRGEVEYEVWMLLGEGAYTVVDEALEQGTRTLDAEQHPDLVLDEEARARPVGPGRFDAISVRLGRITAKTRDDATWAFLERTSWLKAQALAAGQVDTPEHGSGEATVAAPQLAAVPPGGARGGLTFEGHALVPPPQDAYARVKA